jgi:excisionase family DNA binding protein
MRAGAHPFRRKADVFSRRRHQSFWPESLDDLQQDEKWRDRVDENRRAKIDQSAVVASAFGSGVIMPASPRFFAISDVANCLDVSSRTVRRWIADKLLVAHRIKGIVRISELDFAAFLAARRDD